MILSYALVAWVQGIRRYEGVATPGEVSVADVKPGEAG
jgi:hypothetical protein